MLDYLCFFNFQIEKGTYFILILNMISPVSGKMRPGTPIGKRPPRKLPPGKLSPGNRPLRKIAPSGQLPPENCSTKFLLLLTLS